MEMVYCKIDTTNAVTEESIGRTSERKILHLLIFCSFSVVSQMKNHTHHTPHTQHTRKHMHQTTI